MKKVETLKELHNLKTGDYLLLDQDDGFVYLVKVTGRVPDDHGVIVDFINWNASDRTLTWDNYIGIVLDNDHALADEDITIWKIPE
jgi:hypothetical protein